MRLNTYFTAWLALAVAALMAGTAVADDRNFLRQLNAPPNLIFVLDTSGSMVGTPEEPGEVSRPFIPFAMVPGGGDDPGSRMGIAKSVLRAFLEDVDANYVLAGYAQGRPPEPEYPVPRKHWVYEGVGVWDTSSSSYRNDHFHLMEQGYSYRIGWAESFSGVILDNPGNILNSRMIGYTPYFDPDTAVTPVEDRYGPESAVDVDPGRQFDLMPMYLGFTCITDDMGTPADTLDDVQRCAEGIFPFYDSGMNWPDGSMVTEMWYYGFDGDPTRFDNCDPWKTPTALNPDDGCLTTWVDNTGTIPGFFGRKVEFKRRVRLEIPDYNPDTGDPNHPLGLLDPDGAPMTGDELPIGNQLVADMGTEDYDLDGQPDPDLDENAVSDWVLYVDAVEQLAVRDAGPVETPTFTPTHTPTETPTYTPTPTPWLDCGLFFIADDLDRYYNDPSRINLEVRNLTGYNAELVQTYIDWGDTESQSNNPRINYLRFDGDCDDTYWRTDFSGSPAIAEPPHSSGDCPDYDVAIAPWDTDDHDWDAYLYPGESWVGTTCVSLTFYFADFNNYCAVGDCASYSMSTPTPTPTYTPSPTPLPTRTPTYTPTGPTPTPTASNTPTNTYPPTNTYTPSPTLPYYTPTDTPTSPPSATNTPTSPPATNTPTQAATNTPTNTPNIIG